MYYRLNTTELAQNPNRGDVYEKDTSAYNTLARIIRHMEQNMDSFSPARQIFFDDIKGIHEQIKIAYDFIFDNNLNDEGIAGVRQLLKALQSKLATLSRNTDEEGNTILYVTNTNEPIMFCGHCGSTLNIMKWTADVESKRTHQTETYSKIIPVPPIGEPYEIDYEKNDQVESLSHEDTSCPICDNPAIQLEDELDSVGKKVVEHSVHKINAYETITNNK